MTRLNYNTELPGYVRNVLPYGIQTQFRLAYNAELRKGATDKVAIRRAWALLKQEANSAANIQGALHLPKFLAGKKKKKTPDSSAAEGELAGIMMKKLPADATAADYIHDFVNSDDPRFKGKSKAERIQMALGAYYSKRDISKAAPRTLYVCRYVTNGDDIIKWAKSQGFKTTLKPDDLHVTIAFSKTPVDWMKVDISYVASESENNLKIPAGGPRLVEPLGDKGAVVLLFTNSNLTYEHNRIKEAGASWDHFGYQPHITITWDAGGLDLSKVEPYTGPIELGPPIFSEVDDNWVDNITEKRADVYKELIAKAAGLQDDVDVRIAKVDASLGLVFGYAIICKKDGKDYYDLNIDHNGERVPEHITEPAMLEAATEFMQKYRIAKEMHGEDPQGTVVFAFPLTTDIAKALGITARETGLMIAMKPDPVMLRKFLSGELKGFSIGGSRVKVREFTEA